MDTSKDETHITVRIPAEVAETMRQLAKQHDRSLNGEIVRAMREFIERHQQGQEKQDKREN